jgi:hypothetical protein
MGSRRARRTTLNESDKRGFKQLARVLLSASDEELVDLVGEGKFVEVSGDEHE